MISALEKLLEFSMRMEASRCPVIRILGSLIGYFPVKYSRRLEKRLFQGKWHPGRRYTRCRICRYKRKKKKRTKFW